MNRMRQLFQRGEPDWEMEADETPATIDVEAARHGAPLSSHPVNLTAAATDPKQQLSAFRELVGITKELGSGSAPAKGGSKAKTGNASQRVAENIGIYGRVVNNETAARRGFTIYSLIVNGALLTQVVVAAALTAMGAGSVNHSVITAFGAINTVIAGILTYLKDSGMPGRLQNYENSWRKVREAVEQSERDFASAATFGTPLPNGQTLEKAVADIEKLYKDTQTQVENNTPAKQGDGKTSGNPAGGQQGGPPAMPPGTSPELRRGDFAKSSYDGNHATLAHPEKVHTRPTSSSTDETAHGKSVDDAN